MRPGEEVEEVEEVDGLPVLAGEPALPRVQGRPRDLAREIQIGRAHV